MDDKILCPWCGGEMLKPDIRLFGHIGDREYFYGERMCSNPNCKAKSPVAMAIGEEKTAERINAAAQKQWVEPSIDLETIAEAVHNAWWHEKIKQGVTNHPDMLPYAELAENVKEYDRVTAREVLKAIRGETSAAAPWEGEKA